MTQVVTVTIQSGITGIGSGAFADGTKLTKVFISADSLRTVSADAFKNCSNAGVNLFIPEMHRQQFPHLPGHRKYIPVFIIRTMIRHGRMSTGQHMPTHNGLRAVK